MGQAGADGRVICIMGGEGRENDIRSRAMAYGQGERTGGGGLDLTTGDLTTGIGRLVPRRMRTVAIVTGVRLVNLSSPR